MYQESRAVLCESAKEQIGANKVDAICETMVQTFFFRGNSFEDWLDGVPASQKLTPLTMLDARQAGTIEQDQSQSHPAVMALSISRHIAELAGISAADLAALLTAYLVLVQWEMEHRGFSLLPHSWQLQHPLFCLELAGIASIACFKLSE